MLKLLTVALAAAGTYAYLATLELSEARAETAVLKMKNDQLWQIILRPRRESVVRRIRADVVAAEPEPEPEPPTAFAPLPAPADPLDRLGQTYTLEELIWEVFGR